MIFFCIKLNSFNYTKWLNISIWPINGTRTGANTPGQNEAGSNCNERVRYIPQSSKTETSPTDCLVSYPEQSLVEGSYLSAEMQSVYSTAPADWITYRLRVLTEKNKAISTREITYK